ncbi:IclR family transcriptional regulator domain-containing protein [Roseococcus sp. YIM B11640]|uniref:IclR family transcriptional regulator domain-containing protein n=1 Tax=Roseococcus sp. YIM B11640 TaxID=3133973 RepID=UPI003C7CD7D5
MSTRQASTRYAGLEQDLLQSLAKGLAVIEAFGPDTPRMTLSEVARRIGVTPGSAQRVLKTLLHLGYVGQEKQFYSLRPRALMLGYAYLSSQPFTAVVQPMLTALTERTGKSCSLALLDGADVVYVGRATAKHLRRDYVWIGTRIPAHTTSVGKVLLAALPPAELEAWIAHSPLTRVTPHAVADAAALRAELDRVRAQGFGVNDQETIMGIRSIAVPVPFGPRVEAALGMSTEVSAMERGAMESELVPVLREAASAIAATMAARERGESLGVSVWQGMRAV